MSSEYFEAQARDVMERAGGDPGNAGPLAAWAEDARLHRDWQRLGVIVAYDGTLIAETVRLNIMVGITSTYVVDLLVELPDPDDDPPEPSSSSLEHPTSAAATAYCKSISLGTAASRPSRIASISGS